MGAARLSARPHVLIVEDEPLVQCIAEEEFGDAGFNVQSAPDGATALPKLGEMAPYRFPAVFAAAQRIGVAPAS